MQHSAFPQCIELALARAHPEWQPYLRAGLGAMAVERPGYFSDLSLAPFLPTEHRLFAAFSLPPHQTRYVLIGEGPYPRAASATGVCFMDGAVDALWQQGIGLSRQVNRATSLRNFIKMLLVTEGMLCADHTAGVAMQPVARAVCAPDSPWIQNAAQLQSNLLSQGFLLLNASLVFRSTVAPAQDARAWLPFLRFILQALAQQQKTSNNQVQLVLWGKIAEKILALPEADHFTYLVSEHPYNLSFIENETMQNFFRPLHLLKKSP